MIGLKPLMKYHVNVDSQDGKKKLKTWGVIPILSSTKILHGVYNPEQKQLRIYLDSSTEQYQPTPVTEKGKIAIQNRKIDTYYFIELEHQDIPFFLETYVENNFEIESEITEKKTEDNE